MLTPLNKQAKSKYHTNVRFRQSIMWQIHPNEFCINNWFAFKPKILRFYYFKKNIVETKQVLLGVMYYQILPY